MSTQDRKVLAFSDIFQLKVSTTFSYRNRAVNEYMQTGQTDSALVAYTGLGIDAIRRGTGSSSQESLLEISPLVVVQILRIRCRD